MKKKIKYIILFLFIIIISLNLNLYAYSIENVFTDAQDFVSSGESVGSKINITALKDTSSFIFNLLLSIGMVVAVAVGLVLGIQFMVASAADKAKIKEALIAYAVGCGVLFGAYGIWNFIVTVVKTATTI